MKKRSFLTLAAALLATWTLHPGAREAAAFDLSVTNPATGQQVKITIPDDPQKALDALTSDVNSLYQRMGAAADELVASVSGCINDNNGRPVPGAVVFIGDFEVPPYLIFATTQGQAIPAMYKINADITPPLPVPFNVGPGCFWAPLPPGLMDALRRVVTGATGEGGSGSFDVLFVYPLAVGYTFEPRGYTVTNVGGSVSFHPVSSLADIPVARRSSTAPAQ